MKSALILCALMAAKAMASSDPCNSHSDDDACKATENCVWVAKDFGHSSSNHQKNDASLLRGCHMIGVTDRDQIKGRGSNGAADKKETAAFLAMGFHTSLPEMACEEAFTRHDCRTLSKTGNGCDWVCEGTGGSNLDGSCVAAGDGETFQACTVECDVAPANLSDNDCGDIHEKIAACVRADMKDGTYGGDSQQLFDACAAIDSCHSERNHCMYSHYGCVKGYQGGADADAIDLQCTSGTIYTLEDFETEYDITWAADNPDDEPVTFMQALLNEETAADSPDVELLTAAIKAQHLVNDIPYYLEYAGYTIGDTEHPACYGNPNNIIRTYVTEKYGFVHADDCPAGTACAAGASTDFVVGRCVDDDQVA